ncbi:MacB family efflux pump subunit [Variovorax sp. Sphag1AA]|uniref:MacB family efflux pump subunit n=1 Tax=Variovorax sp. Sphag1AA TaxID=2587027 RepID=UPI0016215F63|nr:MacB family efflux pump subunit [Variovorax sp. Sphag1AA]MBB3181766.1 macrolide transport system ATP-binding/permease protein [Variovorax sp. Sphag1AA]
MSAAVDRRSLISIEGLRKRYGGRGGAPEVEVLRGVSLEIEAGEFVAIVGASGSGKSTLMHILGCLDRPSAGRYLFNGHDVGTLDRDQLAWLRREAFGFVFQGYHLIATESALENVEVPALYAGQHEGQRKARARSLLERLGLGDRIDHRPHQLSGGQQQRVSIARALMNGGRVILADEPTGALDSKSGEDVMTLLRDLAEAGHTVIVITHDRKVAAAARRVVEIRDGQIVADSGSTVSAPVVSVPVRPATRTRGASLPSELRDACRAAWRVLWINRFRTSLTLLGIVIGVASVIVMVAIGLGTRQQVVAQASAFGANLLYMSSVGASSRIPGRSVTLADLQALTEIPQLAHVLPNVTGNKVVRFGEKDLQTYVRGTGAAMPEVQDWPVRLGGFFSAEDDRDLAAVAVLGHKLARDLMPDLPNPVGQHVLIENVPFQVIGVMAEKGSAAGDQSYDDLLLMPFTTAGVKLFGQREPTYTAMTVQSGASVDDAEKAVDAVMFERHGIRDYRIGNAAAAIAAKAKTEDSMTLLLALIAAVSLLVGGIGVMNVMLMTVRERTREIGIRMATGARRRDILRQFLTEAVLVSVVGGSAGVALGLGVGAALMALGVPAIFSLRAIVGAFLCATATGLVFGFMPARQAAGLEPVVALASE